MTAIAIDRMTEKLGEHLAALSPQPDRPPFNGAYITITEAEMLSRHLADLVATVRGARPVEDLRLGDRIILDRQVHEVVMLLADAGCCGGPSGCAGSVQVHTDLSEAVDESEPAATFDVGELVPLATTPVAHASRLRPTPYTGPCPDWCEAVRHGIFDARVDHHFARRGSITTSLMCDPQTGEPGTASFEICQHVLDDPEPRVTLAFDFSESVRLTDDETKQISLALLKVDAEVRTIKGRQHRAATS